MFAIRDDFIIVLSRKLFKNIKQTSSKSLFINQHLKLIRVRDLYGGGVENLTLDMRLKDFQSCYRYFANKLLFIIN